MIAVAFNVVAAAYVALFRGVLGGTREMRSSAGSMRTSYQIDGGARRHADLLGRRRRASR